MLTVQVLLPAKQREVYCALFSALSIDYLERYHAMVVSTFGGPLLVKAMSLSFYANIMNGATSSLGHDSSRVVDLTNFGIFMKTDSVQSLDTLVAHWDSSFKRTICGRDEEMKSYSYSASVPDATSGVKSMTLEELFYSR